MVGQAAGTLAAGDDARFAALATGVDAAKGYTDTKTANLMRADAAASINGALKVGGTGTASETLEVAGSILAADVRRLQLSRTTLGGAPNDWVELGNLEASGTASFAKVIIWGHWQSTLFVNEFEVQALQPYAGADVDWIEVAPKSGRGWTNGLQNLALDVRLSAGNGPLELRVRRLTDGGTGSVGSLNVILETGNVFTPKTGSGSAGTVAPGWLGTPGWRFPVSTSRFAASRDEGLYVQADGSVGIGTPNPTAKLDVQGSVNVSGSVVEGCPTGYVDGRTTVGFCYKALPAATWTTQRIACRRDGAQLCPMADLIQLHCTEGPSAANRGIIADNISIHAGAYGYNAGSSLGGYNQGLRPEYNSNTCQSGASTDAYSWGTNSFGAYCCK